MILEQQTSLRNAGFVFVQRGLILLSSLLFVILVPRWLGNIRYGQYTLVASLLVWFSLLSSLGFAQVVGRFMPALMQAGDRASLRRFVGNLMAVRLVAGALTAGLFFMVTAVWLPEIDIRFLLAMSGVVLIQTISNLIYLVFLGANQASRWTAGETLRRWLGLGLMLPGLYLGGLAGIGAALLLTEIVVLILGVWWARGLLSWKALSFSFKDLAPQLRFGLLLYLGDLFLSAFNHTGEALMRSAGGTYLEISYFGIAFNVYYLLSITFSQFSIAFFPYLSLLADEGKKEEVAVWIGRMLKVFTAFGMAVVFGAVWVGKDLVRAALGSSYLPAVESFLPLSAALLFFILANQASLMLMLDGKPKVVLAGAALRLGVFWVLGFVITTSAGSLGTCLAVLGAMLVYAGFFAWKTHLILRKALGQWLVTIFLGCCFLPLAWLNLPVGPNLVLFFLIILSYTGLLVGFKMIPLSEMKALFKILKEKIPVNGIPVNPG